MEAKKICFESLERYVNDNDINEGVLDYAKSIGKQLGKGAKNAGNAVAQKAKNAGQAVAQGAKNVAQGAKDMHQNAQAESGQQDLIKSVQDDHAWLKETRAEVNRVSARYKKNLKMLQAQGVNPKDIGIRTAKDIADDNANREFNDVKLSGGRKTHMGRGNAVANQRSKVRSNAF